MRSLILLICSRNTKHLIKERSLQLGMSIPIYLKYLAIKDIEETKMNNKPNA